MLTVTFHWYVQIWMVHVSICWRETLCDLIILSFNGGVFKGWLNMYYCRRGRGCWWYVEPRGILVIGGNEEHLHESFKRAGWVFLYVVYCLAIVSNWLFCDLLHTPEMGLGHLSRSSFVSSFFGHLCLLSSYHPVSQQFLTYYLIYNLIGWHLLGY